MTSRRELLAWAALAAAGCGDQGGSGGDDGPATQTTFVGDIPGTDVRVAVIRDGDRIALFFCGGDASFATSTKWIRTSAEGAAFTVADGGWTAEVSIDGAAVTGTVDRGDGVPVAWQAARVDEAGLPGLYEAEHEDGRVGVIVGLDGAGEPVAQGALVSATIAAQVVPIAPLERVADRVQVKVLLPDGAKNLTVRRATTAG